MALPDRLARAVSTTAFRVAAATVAAYLAFAGLVVGVLLWQTNRVLTRQVLSTLQAEAGLLKAEAQSGDRAALVRAVEARSRPGGPGLYYLADQSGTKLAGNLSRLPPEIMGSAAGGVFRYAPDVQSNSEHLAVAVPVDIGGGDRLIVGRDVDEQRRFASEMGTVYFLALGFLTLGGLVAGFAVSRVALKRIETINVTARSIMAGDMTRRIAVTGNGDEFDVLATNLNAMLERIEALMSGLREVSDNIAHDLKTPLSRLRNSAEAALRETGADAYREGLEHTIEKADELIKTFNSLLLVARLEAGALEENAERFDVGRAVRDVAELYEPVADERGMALAVNVEAGPQLTGNRQLVVQAVANLIENAIKYSGKPARAETGAAISIDLRNRADAIEIAVADNGPGIAPEDRERVLKRFVRLEKSRTEPGTGLGLSLVQAVARLHAGSVHLEDNRPGLRVVLTLPKRSDDR
ncbi:MAG TPA: HAMP domain-containing sensor histidine kinase [Hyphomicrobium sp.]|jgi:signal transduction histidine kinase